MYSARSYVCVYAYQWFSQWPQEPHPAAGQRSVSRDTASFRVLLNMARDPSMSALPMLRSMFSFAPIPTSPLLHVHASTTAIEIPTVSEQMNEVIIPEQVNKATVEKHTVKIEQKSSNVIYLCLQRQAFHQRRGEA